MNIELYIDPDNTGKKIYQPNVLEGVEWSLERKGVPGKLTFSVLKDSNLVFSEGAAVRMHVNGRHIFLGYVFSQKRDKNGIISITAYDQLRYLKNKDVYKYRDKTASQFIRQLAEDFRLNLGEIEDTKYVIAKKNEDGSTLADMIQNVLDITLQNTGQMYVLYDDFGKLTLKNIANMKVYDGFRYLMIDEESGENFDYESSIDASTYNKIKLTSENEKTGKRDVYISQSSENINKWGVLQYHESLQQNENGQAKADALLSLYNKKTRKLKLTKVFGDIRVRAGSMLIVNLNLGDVKLKNFMLVEKVSHTFNLDEHYMDLTLIGGEFVA